MSRLKVTPAGKIKKNIPITRIGKKQYLKRRFAHIRKVDNAGKNNKLSQKYVKQNHTALQSYSRLGLNANPSLSKKVTEERKKAIKPEMRQKFEAPPEDKVTLGQPISEQEGSTIANLIDKYGTDLKKMSFDRKLNPFQLNPRQLQRRIINYVRFEKAAFPEQYAEMEKIGWLQDFSDKSLRYGKKADVPTVVSQSVEASEVVVSDTAKNSSKAPISAKKKAPPKHKKSK